MSTENARDPRTLLVRSKYFSMRPRGLERWLWRQSLPPAAERVFWFHWDEGMKARDWCSQVPIRLVAAACCIDPATVTRAYQILKQHGLIRREDPGRDPANPFQQATAVTEVRLPRAVLETLAREPDRPRTSTPAAAVGQPMAVPQADTILQAPAVPQTPPPVAQSLQEVRAIFARMSAGERVRFHEASRLRIRYIDFDADTRLTPDERGYLLQSLERLHAKPSFNRLPPACKAISGGMSVRRTLSVLELARIRRRVTEAAQGEGGPEIARQVAWSLAEGALRRFGPAHGLNIALKKIREGSWTRPNRMPPNWLRAGVAPEPCGAV
jgi:hypothetical protein